jgi:hypothetical protein
MCHVGVPKVEEVLRRMKVSFKLRDDTMAFTCTVCMISSIVWQMWYSAFS